MMANWSVRDWLYKIGYDYGGYKVLLNVWEKGKIEESVFSELWNHEIGYVVNMRAKEDDLTAQLLQIEALVKAMQLYTADADPAADEHYYSCLIVILHNLLRDCVAEMEALVDKRKL